MMNIFNIFDPTTGYNHSLNWMSLFIIFFLFPFQYWIIPSRYSMLFFSLINYLYSEFKVQLNHSYSNLLIILSIFFFIMTNNLLGLFPYIFTASSHMSFCLSMSLPMWVGIMLFSWLNYTNTMFSHLTPSGTPSPLMPFMVIIESISLVIRPITLSIRLTANMIAGHLLLSLLGSSGILMNNFLMLFILLCTQIMLLTLEISVALIQAYVFSILSLLYSSEI